MPRSQGHDVHPVGSPCQEHPYRDRQPSWWPFGDNATKVSNGNIQKIKFFVGIDRGSAIHKACVMDIEGNVLVERSFEHSGAGLARMAALIGDVAEADASAVGVAIEVPHGPVVESLMARNFSVHSINPKQLYRFRDRFSPARVKDDRRDARVLADALCTGRQAFRLLRPLSKRTVELRESSRAADSHKRDIVRQTNQMRDQLWNYYPQFLNVDPDLTKAWVRELWRLAPTPEKAMRTREATVAKILKRYKVRRTDAKSVLEILRQPAVDVTPDIAGSAVKRIQGILAVLNVLIDQLGQIHRDMNESVKAIGKA